MHIVRANKRGTACLPTGTKLGVKVRRRVLGDTHVDWAEAATTIKPGIVPGRHGRPMAPQIVYRFHIRLQGEDETVFFDV